MTSKTRIKTADEVKAEFDRKGQSIGEWARKHNVRAGTVYDVLSLRSTARRGTAHKVAVLLGMKEGELS